MPNVVLSNVYYQEQLFSHLQGKEMLQRQANGSQAVYNMSEYEIAAVITGLLTSM